MNVTVIGAGYVGLVSAVCFADLGHNVVCLDVDAQKIEKLHRGEVPIYEPGLSSLIERNVAAKRLQFTLDMAQAVNHAQLQFIAVGTPPDEDGAADLQYVLQVADNIASHMGRFTVIVNKSTVPVGTADLVAKRVQARLTARDESLPFSVVSNPEFLKEGAAIEDFMRPDRIVVGADNSPEGDRAFELMRRLYAPINRNHDRLFRLSVRSSELTKYASNAMLATRISFMNELANLADVVGADIEQVRLGMGSDKRIGYDFLYAGTGYGGSCFPKDVQALQRTAKQYDQSMRVLQAVEDANDMQQSVLINKLTQRLGQDLHGKRFALWGLAFKPNTDDMRQAPSRKIIRTLLERGAHIHAYDPVATHEAQRSLALDLSDRPELLQRLSYASNAADALPGADALLLVTEWKEFRGFNLSELKQALKQALFFDGRNQYDPQAMVNEGIEYFGIGRGTDLGRTHEPRLDEDEMLAA
jgi:UDPglucose 6-dehydrogenase